MDRGENKLNAPPSYSLSETLLQPGEMMSEWRIHQMGEQVDQAVGQLTCVHLDTENVFAFVLPTNSFIALKTTKVSESLSR